MFEGAKKALVSLQRYRGILKWAYPQCWRMQTDHSKFSLSEKIPAGNLPPSPTRNVLEQIAEKHPDAARLTSAGTLDFGSRKELRLHGSQAGLKSTHATLCGITVPSYV